MRSKLFIGNLPIDIREDELQALFAQAGAVIEISIQANARRKKCSAYVTFSSRAEALKAIRLFRGYRFHNRKLKIVEERPLRYSSWKGFSPGGRGIFRIQGLTGGLTGDPTTDAPPPERKKKQK
jgi:RNA recognition motif-containing protein